MFRSTLTICILFAANVPLIAATGDLDAGYGTGGYYRWVPQPPDTYPSHLREEEALDMAIDSQGRMVLAFLIDDPGSSGYAFPVLVRVTPNGELDTTFGIAGRWTESVYATPDTSTMAVGVDSSDRIVVGFTAAVSDGMGGFDDDFAIRRVTAAGTSDIIKITSFFSVSFNRSERINDLAVLSDDRVVAVGEAHYGAGDIDFGIAVWKPNMSDGLDLDPSFNTSGRVLVAFDLPGSTLADSASAVLADGDGLIVAGRATTSQPGTVMAVCRVLLTGVLDSSFGSGGRATFAYQELGGSPYRNNVGRGLTYLAEGGFVLAGYVEEHPAFNERLAMVKFDAGGSVDPSWGSLGWHVANYTYPGEPFSDADSYGEDVVGTPDGGVVAVGYIVDPMAPGQESRGVMTRLTSTGLPDSGFSGSGVAVYAFEDTGDPSYPTETGFSSLLVVDGGRRAMVAGRMRSLDLFSNPPVAGTDRDVMAARILLEAGLFSDGFESGTDGAWSASVP